MPNDTPGQAAAGGPQNVEGAKATLAPDAGQVAEPYLHTWTDKDAAQKGVQDLLEAQKRSQSELDKTRAELKEVRDEQLRRLTEIQESRKGDEGSHTPDRAATLDAIKQRMQKAVDDGDSAAYAELMGELAEGEQAYIDARLSERDSQLQDTLQKLNASIENLSQRTSPDYQAHRPQIEKIMADAEAAGVNMDMKTAMFIAKNVSPVQQPDRPDLPGSTAGGSRVTADEAKPSMPDAEKEAWMSLMGNDIPEAVLKSAIAHEEAARKEAANAN